MCNLNIIIKGDVDSYTNKTIPSFLMGVTSNSYDSNRDGDGLFLNSCNIVTKGKRKVNLYKYEKQILESSIIMTHQRIATSGRTVKYTQPFTNKDFILAHNGVISELVEGNKSDTYVLFKKFVKNFNNSRGERNKRITKAIKKSIREISYGSYSIAIYDKQSKSLYYFKNNGTYIYFYRSKNMLFITTTWSNEPFLEMLSEDFKEIDIDDDTIYRISVNKNIRIQKTGTIEKTKSYGDNYFDYQNNKTKAGVWEDDFKDGELDPQDGPTEDDIEDTLMTGVGINFRDDFDTVLMKHSGNCIECQNRATRQYVITKEFICDDCLGEYDTYEEIRFKRDKDGGYYK